MAARGLWAPSSFEERTTDSNRIEGSWEELKGKAKQRWGNLTDSELTQIGGKKDELMGRLQARYGYSKDKAKEEMESWLESIGQSGESVIAQMNAAKDGAKQVADNFTTAMQKSVENNPIATLAMVAAVSFVIGAIWRA
jgi:uncharacterized protein YjbJ (UPF0337 family)